MSFCSRHNMKLVHLQAEHHQFKQKRWHRACEVQLSCMRLTIHPWEPANTVVYGLPACTTVATVASQLCTAARRWCS